MGEADNTILDGVPDSAAGAFPSGVPSQVARVDRDRHPDRPDDPGDGETRDDGWEQRDVARRARRGLSRYRMVEERGEGELGAVYLAEDLDLRRRVLLKSIRRDHPLRPRFIEEARIMGQFDHPNIASVHELGLDEADRLYYTMPSSAGRSLADLLGELGAGREAESGATVGINRLVQIYLQVCLGVAHAHDRGVVHRDLRPANVWLGAHGEIQVTGWGFARLLATGEMETDRSAILTRIGEQVGTPEWMSPEVAAGSPAEVASDVYSLGVILYQLLCFSLPFEGSANDVCAAHLTEHPVPPRQRSPLNPVPAALERTCLRAMAKLSEERHVSARVLHDEVQAWLEQEADRARRIHLAAALAEDGRGKLDEYREAKAAIREREVEAAELARRFQAMTGPTSGDPGAVLEQRVELGLKGHAVIAILSQVLGIDPENAAARDLLADIFWDWFQDAEAHRDRRARDFYGRMVERYHGGKYARELQGLGSLTVASDPAGANVWLYTVVEKDLCLQARDERRLDPTPVPPLELPMGSYMLVVKQEGRRVVRAPVRIDRNGVRSVQLRLPLPQDVSPGFVFVPAGPFLTGGGVEPLREVETGEYCIAEHPVTMGEYLDFLSWIAAHKPDEAIARAPRKSDGETWVAISEDCRVVPPATHPEFGSWLQRWPAFGLSADDAEAYCRWRSGRDARAYRLATTVEWERAARGVDARPFPWGHQYDSSLCNARGSRESGVGPVTVEDFPTDVSPYGVRGLAGNVREWTSTRASRGRVVVCGGSWLGDEAAACVTARGVGLYVEAEWDVGFRLVHSL